MYKTISFFGAINERTGYGVHGSRFSEALEKLVPVYRNQPGGEVSISLIDSVSIQNVNERLPYPSILYNVWESTLQPDWFIDKLKYFDQLWVASETQKSWSVSQGIPEEFIRVIPEGVDPSIFKPLDNPPVNDTFNFLVVGQFQRRKSTKEICEAFLKAFPDNPDVRMYLSVDTLFPSDPYKTTEERMVAHGFSDPRFVIVHFEEREAYVRRLQECNVYAQCSRSEGFGLPGIEAMACGAVSIMENWGGSTEYSNGALLVRICQLKKPHGIYGNWDVPGQWGEPDYDHLVEVMKDAYDNYSTHKAKALITSTMIRTKFSWESAAKKAYNILEELSSCPVSSEVRIHVDKTVDNPIDKEASIRAYARKFGYDITAIKKRSACFSVDCWPDTPAKMETLKETIKQIHDLGYEVVVTSHYPVPTEVMTLADHFVYEKKDILSGDDHPIYWRQFPDGTTEQKEARVQYHAVAGLNNIRNGINYCRGKYDWIYQMSFDVEVDLQEWLDKVHASDKDMICLHWEEDPKTFGGHLMAAKTEVMDKIYPYLSSWEEYASRWPEHRFLAECWLYEHVSQIIDIPSTCDFITMDILNRYDQTDRTLWGDDSFDCHFVEGPLLQITGSSSMSNNEYDVTWGIPQNPNVYTLKQKVGMFSRPSIKYYLPWTVEARLDGELKFSHTIDLKGKNVIISMGSKALGDTIAWIPYVEEFRKKHDCKVYCSTWWRHIFDYPEIEFITPGSRVEDIYASYEVGCFDDQLDKNVKNWRETNLQKVASDILGLEYQPLRAKLKVGKSKRGNGEPPKPYVCFSEHSTMKNKLWNRDGAWQKVIDYLVSLGYECISISAEKSGLQNVASHNGQPIEHTVRDVAGCEFYIGLNAGPSWIAYALNKPCIMITGVSLEENDFPTPYRVAVDVGCKPCFHDVTVPISRDWLWCHSGKDYACTKEITEQMVIDQIEIIRKGIKE
jgi:autotransporter strand-loop-strand O-heptosyltransferase